MAGIERASSQIGVQTGLQTSRPFRTDLPDPGVGIQQGVNALSGALGQTAKELMANEADTAAKDAANSVVLTKNPETGYFDIPKAPSSFGWYAQKTFDSMVEEKTAQQTFYDQSLRLNEIASKNFSSPEQAVKKMNAHVEGSLSGMDPKIAGRLQHLFTREVQQRSFAIGQRVAARNEENLVENATANQSAAMRGALDAASAGPEADAELKVHLDNYGKSHQQLVQLGRALPETTEVAAAKMKSILAAGSIIQLAKDRFGKEIMSPADYDALTRVASNQLANGEKTIGGFDGQWVRDNLPDASVRNALVAHLQQMKSLTADKWNQSLKQQNYDNIASLYDSPAAPVGKPSNVTDPQMSDHMDEWALRNGVDFKSKEGLQQAFNRFGYIPEKIVKNTFSGIRNMPDAVEHALPLYRALENGLTDRNGITIPSQTNLIDAKDQAFLYLYSRNQMKDPNERYKAARDAVNAGLTEAAGSHFAQLKRAGNFDSQEDIEKALVKGFPSTGMGFLGGKLSALPAGAQEALISRAAILSSSGVPVLQAIEMSKEAFKSLWVVDSSKSLLSGKRNEENGTLAWVQKKDMLPTVPLVGDAKTEDTSYLTPYLRKALGQAEGREIEIVRPGTVLQEGAVADPNAYSLDVPKVKGDLTSDTKTPFKPAIVDQMTSLYKDLPADWELGKTLFFQPNNNGGYSLVYRASDKHLPQDVRDQKTGKLIVIYPAAAAKAQADFAKAENLKRESESYTERNTFPLGEGGAVRPTGGPNGPIELKFVPDPSGTVYRDQLPPVDTERVRAPARLEDILHPDALKPSAIQTPNAVKATGSKGGTIKPSDDQSPRRPDIAFPPGYEPRPRVEKLSFAPNETFVGEGQQAISAALRPPAAPNATVLSALTEQPDRRARPDGYGEKLTGAITVNGNTYSFVNGGGGRGSIPFGEYSIGSFRTADQRKAQGLSNLGDTFDLSNVRDPMAPESARTALRIHKSKGNGTAGCIGIVGGDETFKKFTQDVQTVGAVTLKLGSPQSGQTDMEAPIQAINDKIGSNAAIATDYFQRRGYSDIATAGIIGNLIGESGVDPAAASSKKITASKGIAQWLGTRLTGLSEFADKHNTDMRDLGTQLAFIENELSSSEYRVKSALNKATTVEDATAAFMGFERPKNFLPGKPDAHPSWGNRIEGAKKIIKLIGGQNV